MDLETAAITDPDILAQGISPLSLLELLTKAVEVSNDCRIDFYAASTDADAELINKRGELADEATRHLAEALILSTRIDFVE